MCFIENQSILSTNYINMFELFGCFCINFNKSGQFSINVCKKVSVVTCAFYSFDDKLLDEVTGVQSLIVLSMWETLPAYVLT